MPIYEFRCDCGAGLEALRPMDAPLPDCPRCSNPMRRLIRGAGLLRGASPGRGPQDMPRTWSQTGRGDPRRVTALRRELDTRLALEHRHPELAPVESPVIAHEGRFHQRPLRVDDLSDTHTPATPHRTRSSEC
ncbi:FmdB family zinc ribbon protein [Dactylosporangium sp. CA-092794]|uniref:FmdB family zinc ribbon protein n=1 Tax=Dactylosporangium sp. CA-092794 TaxID=3239929 RepID=UPI003D8CD498